MPGGFEDQNPVPAPWKMVLVRRQWERRLQGHLEGLLMPGLHPGGAGAVLGGFGVLLPWAPRKHRVSASLAGVRGQPHITPPPFSMELGLRRNGHHLALNSAEALGLPAPVEMVSTLCVLDVL